MKLSKANVRGAVPVFAAALLLACGLSRPAHAALVYDNGGPNLQNAWEMSGWIEADDFTVASASTSFDTIRFWSLDNGSYTGSFYWRIYSDNGSTPGTVLSEGSSNSVSRTATGRSNFGLAEYDHTFSIDRVNLTGGTRYWLGLHNGPLSSSSFSGFYWETANSNSTSISYRDQAPFGNGFDPNSGFGADQTQLAFQLSDSNSVAPVPELNTMTLMLVAMAGLMGAAWMRKKKEGASDAPVRLPAGMA